MPVTDRFFSRHRTSTPPSSPRSLPSSNSNSDTSFHTAVPTASAASASVSQPSPQFAPSSPLSRPSLPPLPPLPPPARHLPQPTSTPTLSPASALSVSRSSIRPRWPFSSPAKPLASSDTPPTSPRPKRPRPKQEHRTTITSFPNTPSGGNGGTPTVPNGALSYDARRSQSELSSRSSVDGVRRFPRPPRAPRLSRTARSSEPNSSTSLRMPLSSSPPTDAPFHLTTRAQTHIQSQAPFHSTQSSPLPPLPPLPPPSPLASTSAYSHTPTLSPNRTRATSPQPATSSELPPPPDDWGLDELSDDDGPPLVAASVARGPSRPTADRSSDDPGGANVTTDEISVVHHVSTETPRIAHRDTFTLRAYDDVPQRHASAPTEMSAVGNVIGVFADPAAETDDWGDDFVLDNSSAERDSMSSRLPDLPSPQPPWLERSSRFDSALTEQPRRSSDPSGFLYSPGPARSAAIEVQPLPDDSLPIRAAPPVAFETPTLTYSSLLMYPDIGYQASTVHPNCAKVLELFASHNTTIRKHFDALVRDSGGTIAFDENTRREYLFSRDPDVTDLYSDNADLSAEVLFWKFEWASLTHSHTERARLLLALSKLHKDVGNFEHAKRVVRDALNILASSDSSTLATVIVTELEYEMAILHRADGSLAEAGRSLMRAMTHSISLINCSDFDHRVPAAQQRGLWWLLRCKYLRAEIAYDLEERDTAVQFYSDYLFESVSRMIGATPPPSRARGSLGSGYMRFCLFSPRRLVLAFWMTVLCLGEMRCFGAAADMANLTTLAASAFGYEDANEAAAYSRFRIREIGIEIRQQYDEVSKTLARREENDLAEPHVSSTANVSQIPSAPFNYSVQDFGEVEDDIVEDWDTQLERELNITIQRCCDVDAGEDKSVAGSFSSDAHGDHSVQQPESGNGFSIGHHSSEGRVLNRFQDRFLQNRNSDSHDHRSRWLRGTQEGQLIEAELRQYLYRLTGSGTTLPSRLMFPKPTEPFEGQLMGPKEHERFLRTFVRSKDPEWCWRSRHGLTLTPQWHPSAVCKLNFNIEPIEDIDTFNFGIDILSPSLGIRLLESVWKVVRSQVSIHTKQSRVRRLILNAFSKVAASSKRIPTHDEVDRRDRLEMLGALIDALRLAREVVTDSGKEAVWFSRACMFLGTAAATVTPTAKAAVELFQAESRAHCGVNAVVPSKMIQKVAKFAEGQIEDDVIFTKVGAVDESLEKRNAVPTSLRQTVVDLLHALYWRTKAGFDESSASNSLERLLHADVASSLFLTGSGISPVDGSPIDLSKEIRILHIPKRRRTKSIDSETVVDETRRVSSSELVDEMHSLWSFLPFSAGVVRAKLSFALAHHARVTQKNYSRAERFLFDGLRSLHAISEAESFPRSFFSPVPSVSPVSIVSSPLAGAILNGYSDLTSSHSKYRYGVAAREAICDAVRVRNMGKQMYRAAVFEVVDLALLNNDWRRALGLLYNVRSLVHPKNGLRNEFLCLCTMMHDICRAAGCFNASIIPLRAYSALIYEERLRILLQRYKRRLAKKKKNRIRRYLSGSPLPRLLPGSSVFSAKKNALASFFEVQAMTAAIDTTLRQSVHILDSTSFSGPKKGTLTPMTEPSPTMGFIHRLISILLPIRILLFHRSSTGQLGQNGESVAELRDIENPNETHESPSEGLRSPVDRSNNHTRNINETEPKLGTQKPILVQDYKENSEFEEEQRELLRIEAEQDVSIDFDRCRVEFLRIETDYAKGDYYAVDERCHELLKISIPSQMKCKVLEVLAQIRLKRREITRCLEIIELLEHEYCRMDGDSSSIEQESQDDNPRLSIFRFTEQERLPKGNITTPQFIPSTTFLRLRALTHGGRLHEALQIADKALELCRESSFWNQGRVHYLRGKILYAMSNISAPLYQAEGDVVTGRSEGDSESERTMKLTELTLMAFETSSQYFDAAGDELSEAKSDLQWARTCIDYLFRGVVLSEDSGGGIPLSVACKLISRHIVISEVQQVIYNVLSLSSYANVPFLFIDSMISLAEVKRIRGHPTASWSSWLMEAWKLFSRLLANTEDMTVVLSSLSPVSTLIRLRRTCGRLVRLVMCNDNIIAPADMNKHLRMFEAYVKLHLSVDLKMNLSSSAHAVSSHTSGKSSRGVDENLEAQTNATDTPVSISPAVSNGGNCRVSNVSGRSIPKVNMPSSSPHSKQNVRSVRDAKSEIATDSFNYSRPSTMIRRMVGNEGVALGTRGLSTFLNRPRRQVMSAVKGTGAVFIPSNFFSNSRAIPGCQLQELGKDAELIFPFKPSLGLGAMEILEKENDNNCVHFSLSGNIELTNKEPSETAPEAHPHPLPSKRTPDDEITITGSVTSLLHTSDSEAKRPEGKDNIEIVEERSGSTVPNLWRKPSRILRKSLSSRNFRNALEVKERTARIENELTSLVKAIIAELEGGKVEMTGESSLYGENVAERVWAHMYRVKANAKRYMHGKIAMQQLHERNYEAVQSWAQCIPMSNKEWVVPESIGRRLVYILFAHGVIGYYAVERGGSIARVAFGGKQGLNCKTEDQKGISEFPESVPRPPTNAEQKYLSEIVKGFKRDEVWYKNRDSEIVHGLANHVLHAPRLLLATTSPAHKSRSRPIVLVTDLSLQVLPWELFFDHVVIRAHCLLDVIRGFQDGANMFGGPMEVDDPVIAATRPIVKYFNFVPSRKEVSDIERTEEARRQRLAFQGLLRLNHMNPASLVSFLDLGGFSDPTAVNAVARPMGPLSSPLTQSRNGLQLMGVRVAIASIGKRNYPHLDFVKVPGLGSATTRDLKEAAFNLQPATDVLALDQGRRKDFGAYIPVFMFSYAELVDSSESVFGLRREIPNGILMFTPAIHMKVLARHLQDEELSEELARASGRLQNRIFPDIVGAARAVVEHVSRFSREKRIPIVVFLGEGLMEVFPGRRNASRTIGERKAIPAADRIVQLSGGGRKGFLRPQ